MPGRTSDEALRDALSATGRVTQQRLSCLRALQDADRHLTGNELVDDVRAELPHIRPSTVYRTMARFVETGMAHRVDGFRGSRYGVGHGHGHAVCPRCDRIDDLDIREAMPLLERASGPVLGVTVVALCGGCRRTAAPR